MSLQSELEQLNILILRMADKVSSNLKEAFDCYLNYDSSIEYDEINDDIVDAQERLIEEECINIMLKERPYSRDLRRVSGILKLVADLERLGDHAEDVMSFAIKLKNLERHQITEINLMIDDAMSMVSDSIKSFVTGDISLANSVIAKDDIVDMKYDELIKKIIDITKDENVSSSFAIYSTLVVKYIERIADHAVNIAEWVVYIESGYHKDKQIC